LGTGNESRGKKLPPLASFLDGSAPRLVLKATNEPRLRCTEFDEMGNVTLVNGEFKKSELIQMVCLDRNKVK
jgi:magnesium transporter